MNTYTNTDMMPSTLIHQSSMSEKQWTIQVNTETQTVDKKSRWINKVKSELNNLSETSRRNSQRWRKQSIYKIPWSLRELCSEAYMPQTVSIGPYHHGQDRLSGMEEHKHRALLNFLSRSEKPVHCYLDALAQVVEDLKDAYSQLEMKWKQDNEAFVELMMVDGCFLLELMRATTAEPRQLEKMGYAENDPVFSNHGRLYIVPYLKRDILMLENQLPMLALTTLLANENDTLMIENLSKQGEATRLILKFLSEKHESSIINQLGKCYHILDAYRKSLLLASPYQRHRKPHQKHTSWLCRPHKDHHDEYIRSATELDEAGIVFKKSKSKSLNDISFHNGVLQLPVIVVDDTLESQYLNLMAFERFHVGAGNEVTSYVFFMDNIIDSAGDVSLLHSCRILKNALGSDKAVARLFNSLSKDIILDPDSSLGNVHKQVREYCRKPWPRWKASLKHNYFTNPWAVISVFAAFFLFALTSVQTVFTVLGYDPKK